MNLNPLFFNKLLNDKNLINSNGINLVGQSYLFADIINVTCEELSAETQAQSKNLANLNFPIINNIDIQIPVSEGLLVEFNKLISESGSENESKSIYNLDNTKITKSNNLINEDALLTLIAGLNQLINPEVNKLEVVNASKLQQTNETPFEINVKTLPQQGLTLDIIKDVLEDHNAIKFTLKSKSEKITIQISKVDSDNVIVDQTLKNFAEFSDKNNSLTIDAVKHVASGSVENVQGKESDVSNNTSGNSEVKTTSQFDDQKESDLTVISNYDQTTTAPLPSIDKKDNSGSIDFTGENVEPKYKVEINHSETSNNISKSSSGPKIPFILDIKTSREIGEFLSKYSDEDFYLSEPKELPDTIDQNNIAPKTQIDSNDSITTKTEPKQTNLVYISGNELTENEKEVLFSDLKRTSTENLRAIKIESHEKNSFEKQQPLNLTKSEIDLITNNMKSVKLEKPSLEKEPNVKTENVTVANPDENTPEQNSEIVNGARNKNPLETNYETKKAVLTDDTKENILISGKNSDSERMVKDDDSSLSVRSILESENKSEKLAAGSDNFNNSEKEMKSEPQVKETKSKNNKNEEYSDETVSPTKPVKESIKHNELNNHPVFDKKPVEISDLSNKIVTTANVFKETVKKVKSNEIVSEINKYLSTNEKQSITFQLTPKNLGTVKLTVDFVENALKATVEVENEQIKQIIQSNVEQLKATLQNNGIQLSSINVNLSNNETKAQKQFASKKKNYNTFSEPKVEQKNGITGKKKLGYNTYEYLV